MIGKILGNRYEVGERIGDGGTAFVYKAQDTLLNRNVTIKVLRPEYVSDKDFVRRFRREAQAAASLSHPNIVSIYDVGCEDSIHYIIMEYIQGRSLKELVEESGRLTVKMAVDYTCQIANALSHAHRHGIVHRDVKPHNILITEDGRVKVTDFGIAQAVTMATVTYSGAILGSVHYFSPEQAKGAQTGEKSDIYSLGVVLYEMLTGSVPYEGDSPVSVALKHIQEPFPDPNILNDELPDTIIQVIHKAVEKDPEHRYGSAQEMAAELCNLADKPIIKDKKRFSSNRTAVNNGKQKKKFFASRAGVAIIIIFLLAALAFGFFMLRSLLFVPELEMPLVEGETISSAAKILDDAGLKYKVVDEMHDDEIPSGYVLKQNPAAGKSIKQTREAELTLSLGPILLEVPDVTGRNELEATLTLHGMGFTTDITREFSELAPGTVIRQDPGEGFNLSRGSQVNLTISKGGKPFPMKNLVGVSLPDAKEWIELFGLKLRFVDNQPSNTYAEGLVFNQHPAAGEMVQSGDSVDLVISKGNQSGGQKPQDLDENEED